MPRKGQRKPNRYTVDPVTGCWLWNLSVSTDGYAQENRDGKTTRLHIANYIEKYGPVPDGLELDHKCRIRRCINPDHLEPVPHSINIRRGLRAKLSAIQVAEIKIKFALGETKLGLSKVYGVSRRQIKRVVENLQWKEVNSGVTSVPACSVGY